MSDITVSVVISVTTKTPPNAVAANTNDYSLVQNIVYEFLPEVVSQEITFTVLADNVAEMLEGVMLSVSAADGSPTVLPGSNPTTDVFITDNDGTN